VVQAFFGAEDERRHHSVAVDATRSVRSGGDPAMTGGSMSSSRCRFRRPLAMTIAVLAMAGPLSGCHNRENGEARPAQARESTGNPNVLERHEMNPSASTFFELIQGRLAGVLIRRRGSNVSVEIRGQNSISGTSEALVLIDGVENSSRALSTINPSDIERVEVVKDGAAALYGVRGANGVLLITTRRR
jgi:TonB-dependent SusC/RagA subfamily outer membrane receptor